MEIFARFTHDSFENADDKSAFLAVTVKAPSLDWVKKRPKLCVLPVIDLSGSMQGDKLKYAKESLVKLVDQLQDGDFAGLVAFESSAHVIVKPQEVTAALKDKLRAKINDLHVMGGTNLSDGMLTALKLIRELDLPANFLKRAIIFTDGQPTEGITDTNTIINLLDKNRGSATMSAFGYGVVGGGVWAGCDQEFLTRFSEHGCGNYAYVQNPDDSLAAFGKELGGLLSTYATDLTLEIEPTNGHQITKVVSNVSHRDADILGTIAIPFSDILSEETRHFVFEVKLMKQAKVFPRSVSVFNIRLSYSILTEDGTKETRKVETKAKTRFVRAEDADKEANREVQEIVNLHRLVRTQLDAEEKAKKGDFAGAVSDLNLFETEIGGFANIAAAAGQARRALSSQASYVSSQGFLRGMSSGITRGYGVSSYDASAQATLESVGTPLANAAMNATVHRFTTDQTAPPPSSTQGKSG